MSIALLIGNGINRLNNTEASWENVLKALAASHPNKRELQLIKHKPFALLYEEILLARTPVGRQPDEFSLKRKVAEMVAKLRDNNFHGRLMSSSVRHILTTNYDYSLEVRSRDRYPRANVKPESKYSVYRRRSVGDKFVWHIHGEVSAPATITLGYDQYCGYLQRLRQHATAERSGLKGSPFKRKELDFDERTDCPYSWLDVFFRDDIHIIGLTLDFTEIDLWWALTYKAMLRARNFKTGTTHYYDWYRDEINDARLAKHSLLRALGVSVDSRQVTGSFDPLYDRLLTNLLKV